MADDVRVKARIEIDPAATKASIDKAMRSPLEQIQKDAQAQFKNFTIGIQKGIGITPPSAAGGGGAAGVAGKMLGTLALINVGIGAAVTALGGIWDNAVKSSPKLQGVLKVLEAAMTLFFKPFGDFLGSLLRPLAYWLIKMAIDFNKFLAGFKAGEAPAGVAVQETKADLIAQMQQEGVPIGSTVFQSKVPDLPENASTELVDKAKAYQQALNDQQFELSRIQESNRDTIMNAWQKLHDEWGKGIGETKDKLVDAWQKAHDKVHEWWDKDITPAIDNFFGWLGGVWEGVKKWWDENVKPHIDKFFSAMETGWKAIQDFWTNTVKPLIDSVFLAWDKFWTGLKDFLDNNQIWQSIKDAVKNFVNAFISVINNAIDWIKNMTGGVVNLSGFKLKPITGFQTGTDFVPQTGMYMLHRGEAIVPKTENKASMGDMSISVNVSGVNVYNNYDVSKLADDLARELNVKIREKVPYGRGFT